MFRERGGFLSYYSSESIWFMWTSGKFSWPWNSCDLLNWVIVFFLFSRQIELVSYIFQLIWYISFHGHGIHILFSIGFLFLLCFQAIFQLIRFISFHGHGIHIIFSIGFLFLFMLLSHIELVFCIFQLIWYTIRKSSWLGVYLLHASVNQHGLLDIWAKEQLLTQG